MSGLKVEGMMMYDKPQSKPTERRGGEGRGGEGRGGEGRGGEGRGGEGRGGEGEEGGGRGREREKKGQDTLWFVGSMTARHTTVVAMS